MHSTRGFSLLEVMVALAILVVSLTILVETQSNAVVMTREAERVISATDLANAKMTDAMLHLEEEGFQNSQIYESGDFDDWGDDALSMEFGRELEDFEWEFWISEIDLKLAGDIAGMAQELQGSGAFGAGGAGDPADLGGAAGGLGGLGALMSPEMITEMLAPFIREVRVRVWWGDDSDEAEENGSEIVIVTHAVNPTGVVQAMGGAEGEAP